MFKLVLLTLFCAPAFARPSSDLPIESYIVGGIPAKEGQFPYAVSLRYGDKNQFFCGAALISDRYILTAKHCVVNDKPHLISVGLGSINLPSQKIYKVDKIILHPPNNSSELFDDIALVRLSSPVSLGGNVQAILPFPNNDQLVDKNVTAIGWGRTSENGTGSPNLLYLNKSIVSNEFCQKSIGPKTPIGPGNICMGTELNYGMCFGDSGSPLIHQAADGKIYTVGIVSWGIPCAKGYPDVFTRVSYYNKWIEENTK